MTKPNTVFYYLNNLTFHKTELDFTDPNVSANYDPFMINRWISMSDINIPLINNINKYNMPKDVHYKYLLNKLPQRKQFFEYIKKSEDEFKVKKMICAFFECNMKEAADYLNRLDDDTIQEVIDAFQYGNGKMIDI